MVLHQEAKSEKVVAEHIRSQSARKCPTPGQCKTDPLPQVAKVQIAAGQQESSVHQAQLGRLPCKGLLLLMSKIG